MNLALFREFGMVDGFALFVALLGTILYVLETYVLFRKPDKVFGEWVAGVTLLVFLFYFFGNFLALFSRALVADVANVAYRTGWVIATVGFALIPSLLIHAYGSSFYFAQAKPGPKERGPTAIIPNAVLGLSHLIGLYFVYQFLKDVSSTTPLPWPVLTSNIAPFQFKLYALWLGFGSAVVAVYSLRMRKTSGWERWHRYFPINGIFFLIASIVVVVVLLQHPWTPAIAPLVRLLFLCIAFVPAVLLAYFLVQYQFMHVFVKPSLIYAVLTGAIVLIYQLGIRNVSKYLAQFPAVNVGLVELVLVLGLIFLAQPARVKLQAKMNALFFHETKKYRDTVHNISRQLKSALGMDKLLAGVSAQLKQILMVEWLEVIAYSAPEAERFRATFDFLKMSKEPILFGQGAYGGVSNELAAGAVELVVAVREGDEILGLICVGPKQHAQAISNDEVYMLRTIANQLAIAIRYAALAEEQLKLERLMIRQEKLSTLGQITASITHEVKNPLSSINTLVQVMQEELPRGEDLKTDLATIRDEIDHLNRVLSGIVKYAKPGSMDVRAVSVGEVLRDVQVLLQKEGQRHGVDLVLSDEAHVSVMATLDGLKEIFFNLMFNAIEACGKSGGKVAVASRIRDGDVVVKVEDTGPGIAEDELAAIFDPFYTTKQAGSGLGLAIVKEKVESFRGTVTACNLDGGGACFVVEIPIAGESEGKA